MPAFPAFARFRRAGSSLALIPAACLICSYFATAGRADIGGATGNEPLQNEHWPDGAAAVFNFAGRVAWWDGPPLGGGHYHAECRGEAKQLSEVLAAFARIDSKNKRVVLHDGVGASFWLNPSRDPAKADAAKIDWSFQVWSKPNWQRSLGRNAAPDAEPLTQLDVYTAGNVKWDDVVVPKGLTIVDNRK